LLPTAQADAVKAIVRAIELLPDHDFYFGVDSLGKESLLVEIATRTQLKVH
jgi:hypothetical protein